MRSTIGSGVLAALLFAGGGCGDDAVPGMDAAGMDSGRDASPPDTGTDAGPGDAGEDAGPDQDAGPGDAGAGDAGPERCDRPGLFERVGCGTRCGTTERFCTAEGIWEYGTCEGESSICEAGDRDMIPCGMCGMQPARCRDDCRWEPLGDCGGESGECLPGMVDTDPSDCTMGRFRISTCGDDCELGAAGDCTDTPVDTDGDGWPYAVDCDDTTDTIFPGATRLCGVFHCEGGPPRNGVSACMGPGWSLCERPIGCAETSDCRLFFPPEERRSCATGRCGGFAPEQFRSCDFGTGRFGPWSACPEPPPVPPECESIAPVTCGACDEGDAFERCDGFCMTVRTECEGEGCVPGFITRDPTGCPPDQVREAICTAMCTPGTFSACMPPTGGLRNYRITTITPRCLDIGMAPAIAGVMGDDSASAVFPGPFPFELHGEPMTHYAVTTNGFIQLFPDAMGIPEPIFTNTPLPDPARPNGIIAALWDDLASFRPPPPGPEGSARQAVIGMPPARVAVVEWTDFAFLGDATSHLTFQIQVYETSNVIEFHYCRLEGNPLSAGGGSASVGTESVDGMTGAQHSFDMPDSVSTMTALRFTPSL